VDDKPGGEGGGDMRVSGGVKMEKGGPGMAGRGSVKCRDGNESKKKDSGKRGGGHETSMEELNHKKGK